ncbi:hypothetical protein [Trichocoleus sp. FACHB-591]|uniref:hypothetical protein n=1 Tax=Trichocoleus sp. FACHB-591 TaxID=2692872 RepID=UPI00168441A2|nr:hypothetical protein [Trichocoleus sp. FACHB-591]
MPDIHPTELQLLLEAKRRNTLAAWCAIAALPFCAGMMLATRSPWLKLGGAGLGTAFTVVGALASSAAKDAEYRLQDWSDISAQSYQNRLYKLMNPVNATVTTVEAEVAPEIYNFDSILDEAVGIALLGNSGSGKSSVAKYIINLMGETQILVLDPHDDGDTWGGLPVVSSYEGIAEQLELLLTELDNRGPKRRRKERLDPVVVVCDEWPAVRSYCQQNSLDVADRFLLRFGSESRKFNMLCMFCSQSGNTKALGLEGKGDFLENYLLIRLHKVALKYAKNLSDRTVVQRLKQQGFPCLVGEDVSIHPTHGHYPQFKKGLPPANLKPLHPSPLTFATTKHLVLPSSPPVHQLTPSEVHPGSPEASEPVHPKGEPNLVNQFTNLPTHSPQRQSLGQLNLCCSLRPKVGPKTKSFPIYGTPQRARGSATVKRAKSIWRSLTNRQTSLGSQTLRHSI